jgi:hypothetical protein
MVALPAHAVIQYDQAFVAPELVAEGDLRVNDAAHDERHRRGQAELRTSPRRLAGRAGGFPGNSNVIRHVYP